MISEHSYNELKKYTEPYSPKRDEYESFVCLKRDGYVKIHHFATVDLGQLGRSQAPDSYIITKAGRDALSEFEKVRDQQTKGERQQRFQNKVSVLSALVPLATFFFQQEGDDFFGVAHECCDHVGCHPHSGFSCGDASIRAKKLLWHPASIFLRFRQFFELPQP